MTIMEKAGEPVTELGRRAFLSLLVGVGGSRTSSRRPDSSRPRHGGVLKHIGLEPPTFDIHGAAATGTQLISSFARRGLFKLANGSRYRPSDFTLVPDLAQHAAVSTDGR